MTMMFIIVMRQEMVGLVAYEVSGNYQVHVLIRPS
jgi:hypothetical protein